MLIKTSGRLPELVQLLRATATAIRHGTPLPGPLRDGLHMKTEWAIRRFRDDWAFLRGNPDPVLDPVTGLLLPAESFIHGNLALNEGLTTLQNLLIGIADTVFDNTNAYLGVGDDTTAEDATQTDLQAATNKLYKGMESGYPAISSQTTTWQASFGTSEANFAWQELTVANGATGSASNLNRKVSDQGTKATGTWLMNLSITFS